jgi:hypothetical protein
LLVFCWFCRKESGYLVRFFLWISQRSCVYFYRESFSSTDTQLLFLFVCLSVWNKGY